MNIIGMTTEKISDKQKAVVKQGDTCVVGLIGQGTSRELTQSWQSPFTSDSLQSKLAGGAGMGKAIGRGAEMMGAKLVAKINTRKVWESSELEHPLVLHFFCHPGSGSAKECVSDPIQALEEMSSAELSELIPGGRQPQGISLYLCRKYFFEDCRITNVSTPFDVEKDKNGDMLRATVNLGVTPFQMLDKRDLAATWGSSQIIQ